MFHIGDQVQCISMPKGCNFTLGKVYTVVEFDGKGDSDKWNSILEDGGGTLRMVNHRAIAPYFKLVSSSFSQNEQFTKVPKECVHQMKEYVGFTERYMYCTHCDKKG